MSADQTATGIAKATDEARSGDVLRQQFEEFVRQWAPADPRANARFHSELFMMVRTIQADAARPYERAMGLMMGAMPLVHMPGKVDVT